jgi:hypothetical protein
VRCGLENALKGARVFGGSGVAVADLVSVELQGVIERSMKRTAAALAR